jgi:hypothetical protein
MNIIFDKFDVKDIVTINNNLPESITKNYSKLKIKGVMAPKIYKIIINDLINKLKKTI